MCTKTEVQEVVDASEKRMSEKIEELRMSMSDRFQAMDEDIYKKYTDAIAKVHETAPATDARLKNLEGWKRGTLAFLAANIVVVVCLIYSIGRWTSSVEAGMKQTGEKIDVLMKMSEGWLGSKDALMFQVKLDAIDKRIDSLEDKKSGKNNL